MIGLISLDLDGTLLRSDQTLSEYTCSVIERIVEAGVHFSYATARSIDTDTIGIVKYSASAFLFFADLSFSSYMPSCSVYSERIFSSSSVKRRR